MVYVVHFLSGSLLYPCFQNHVKFLLNTQCLYLFINDTVDFHKKSAPRGTFVDRGYQGGAPTFYWGTRKSQGHRIGMASFSDGSLHVVDVSLRLSSGERNDVDGVETSWLHNFHPDPWGQMNPF